MSRDKKPQLERFKDAARELGADDDEERFAEKLRWIVKQPKDDKPSDDSSGRSLWP